MTPDIIEIHRCITQFYGDKGNGTIVWKQLRVEYYQRVLRRRSDRDEWATSPWQPHHARLH